MSPKIFKLNRLRVFAVEATKRIEQLLQSLISFLKRKKNLAKTMSTLIICSIERKEMKH